MILEPFAGLPLKRRDLMEALAERGDHRFWEVLPWEQRPGLLDVPWVYFLPTGERCFRFAAPYGSYLP